MECTGVQAAKTFIHFQIFPTLFDRDSIEANMTLRNTEHMTFFKSCMNKVQGAEIFIQSPSPLILV